MAKFKVNWDNGANACGTFPQVFDTEAKAQAFADDWVAEMTDGIGEDYDGEGYSAEVILAEADKGEQIR